MLSLCIICITYYILWHDYFATMKELPWWQVLIDGPLIHFWVTCTPVLTLVDVLLDGCHRRNQSRCDLTVEVGDKHRIIHKRSLPTPTGPQSSHLCTAFKNQLRNQLCTATIHTHTAHTHSISLNDMRLTHIDRLIFVGVCGGVETPLWHTLLHSQQDQLYSGSPRQTY